MNYSNFSIIINCFYSSSILERHFVCHSTYNPPSTLLGRAWASPTLLGSSHIIVVSLSEPNTSRVVIYYIDGSGYSSGSRTILSCITVVCSNCWVEVNIASFACIGICPAAGWIIHLYKRAARKKNFKTHVTSTKNVADCFNVCKPFVKQGATCRWC